MAYATTPDIHERFESDIAEHALTVLRDDGLYRHLRCKLCGAQHRTEGDGRGAVAYCMAEGHPAELEEVEAVGPAWEPKP